MAKCMITKIGGSLNTDHLTAQATDVVENELFIGFGSDEEQKGTIKKNNNSNTITPYSGYDIPDGYHPGSEIVSLPLETMAAMEINPGAQKIQVATAHKVIQGDIVVRAVSNLTPENIKKGVRVGGVLGNFEGWVDVDPAYLYYNGFIKEGQSITKLAQWRRSDQHSDVELHVYRDRIAGSYPGNTNTIHYSNIFVFDSPIDFGQYSRIEFELNINYIPRPSKGIQLYAYTYTNRVNTYMHYQWPNSSLGASLAPENPNKDDTLSSGIQTYGGIYPQTYLICYEDTANYGKYYIDISGVSGTGYLYIGFMNSIRPKSDINLEIYTIKLI